MVVLFCPFQGCFLRKIGFLVLSPLDLSTYWKSIIDEMISVYSVLCDLHRGRSLPTHLSWLTVWTLRQDSVTFGGVVPPQSLPTHPSVLQTETTHYCSVRWSHNPLRCTPRTWRWGYLVFVPRKGEGITPSQSTPGHLSVLQVVTYITTVGEGYHSDLRDPPCHYSTTTVKSYPP